MSASALLYPARRRALHPVGMARRSALPPIDSPGGSAPRLRLATFAEPRDLALLSDEELLGHYRDTRLAEAFEELLRRYSPKLARYLSRYLGNAAQAEDVLQETLLQIHLKCHLYRDGRPARPWLYAIAHHRAVDILRRSNRLPLTHLGSGRADGDAGSLVDLLASDEPGPLDALQESDRHRCVREGVARLPEPFREVLVLAYYQDLPYAEIADALGIPLGTVKSRLYGAIARLRAMLERARRP